MFFDTLHFIESLISYLTSGESLMSSTQKAYSAKKDIISVQAKKWLDLIHNGQDCTAFYENIKESENLSLFLILESGRQGLPIIQSLKELYIEIKKSNHLKIKEYNQSLPYKMLFPMLFMFFPALTILFLGPYILEFQRIMAE